MASGLFSPERNFSLYTVPIAYILAIAPHAIAIGLYGSKFDNRQPRSFPESVKDDQSLDNSTRGQLLRLSGASANGLENIGLFAAAVVAGNVAGLSNETLNRLSMSYVGSRLLFNLLYYGNTTQPRAAARSTVFWLGQVIIGSLFIRGGQALNVLSLANIAHRTRRDF